MSRDRGSKKPERKSFRGEFSFVNKDASNIDSKEHNAHVSWHVVNRYERWKRQEQAKRLPELGGKAQNLSQTSYGQDPVVVRKTRRRSTWDQLTNLQLVTEETPFASYPPSPWNIDSAEQSMLESASRGNTRQSEQTDDLGLDYVNSLLPNEPSFVRRDVNATQEFTAFLQSAQFPPLITKIVAFAAETIIPTFWPGEMGKYRWRYEIARTLEELTAISLDPCYASATLCYYATIMASMTGDNDIASQACFFQTQAMTELQLRIRPQSGGYNLFTLKSILRLFSAETALDNTSTARIHLKMLRNIITLEGGVILLEAWFRENLLSADTYFALKYETRPLFPASEWTPGPLSQPWKTRLASAHFTGDHMPTVDAAIDGVLKSIIIDLRELYRTQHYIDLHETSNDDQLLRWRQLRKFDCLSRLADHQLSVKIYPHLFERPKLQSAVCAGIALLTAMVLGGPEPTRFDAKLTKDLCERVASAREELEHESGRDAIPDSPKADNVIYWLLHIGMLSVRCHQFSSDDLWFHSELDSAAAQLRLWKPEDCLAVNKQFLFSQHLVEGIEASSSRQESGSVHGIYEACGMSWKSPNY